MRRRIAVISVGVAGVAVIGGVVWAPPAVAAPHGKRVILSPRAHQKVPARPLRIRVRAGRHAHLRAKLNGRVIEPRHFKRGIRPRVRWTKASPSHGLKHGRNRLRVSVRPHGKRRPHRQRVRFRVRKNAPLAAAGLDRRAVAGAPLQLSAAESRVHPSARVPGGTLGGPNSGLDYQWSVRHAPRGSELRGGLPLGAANATFPTVTPTQPGRYVFRLRVTASDGKTGRDNLTVDAHAPPMVDVDTQAAEAKDGGISVGGHTYEADPGAWLQIVVLDRNTLKQISNQSFPCTGPTQPCIDQVKKAFSGESALDDTDLVLAANHPQGGRPPAGAPDALKAIGVGVSDRGWPWYVDPTSAKASGGYSAIGVPGFPSGTAAEAWDRNSDPSASCDVNCAAVRGYLMQDYTDNLDYNWISSARVPFDTRADGSSDTQNVVQIGNRKYQQQLEAGQTGGFQVVVADRYDLSKVKTHWFPTAGPGVNEATYQGSLDGMAATLRDAASSPVVNGLAGNNGKPLCLDLKDYNFFGQTVTLAVSATCDGTSEQQVVAVPGISPGDGSAGVELRAKGGCIEVAGDGEQPWVALDNCGGQEWQQWHFDDQGRIVAFNGKCLAISGAAADHNKPGQPLVVASCQPYVSQQWHTDSSKMAFVAPVAKPQVRLTGGSPDEKTTYDRGLKIRAVGEAVAALGGTANAFNSLPGGSTPQLYGLVGWAGAVPARAPEEAGPISNEMPTARIAGTLSSDKWQRFELQDGDSGAARVQPDAAPPADCLKDVVACAETTDPMDVVWGAPTTQWPDQGDTGKQTAVAWISNRPGINRGGDIRAAFFKDRWTSEEATGWAKTSDTISKLSYSDCDAACQQTFTETDFKWAQSELMQEIDDLLTVHAYFAQLLMAQGSAGAVFNFENQVSQIKTKLETDKVVPPPSPKDKTGVWARFIVNTAIEAVGVIPAIGPFAKEGFEIARSIIDGGAGIMNGILDGMEIAKDEEAGEPGPPSDEVAGAVNDVNQKIVDQYTSAQNSTDMFARIVASDPAKLEKVAALRLGCRDNDKCDAAADWRLEANDQVLSSSMFSYATQRTIWSTLVPAFYTAWQLRIRAYGPNVQHIGAKHYPTTVTGFTDPRKLQCYFNPGIGPEQYIHPFSGASANGAAAFRQGYGYEGDGQWEGPSGSLDYGSNGLLWKLWVLGIRPDGDNENYTVPGPHVFDRLFEPLDKNLVADPQKNLGGLGVDKESWYAQTFAARQYSPKASKWYGNDQVANCDYGG